MTIEEYFMLDCKNLVEFVESECKNLVKFVEYIKTNFPNLEDMPEEDWVDQYMSFINNQ